MRYEATIKPLARLIRFDKPIGTFLLLWPTLWALWIANQGVPNLKILVIFILGVLGMRSAGCVINDIADRKLDGHVARTRGRPLVTGAVDLKMAILLFVSLCLFCLLLVLQLNAFTIQLSLIGLILAVIYPFSKRVTYFPQFILGLAFAWSVPMAFAAESNAIPAIGWLVFGIGVLWPFAYDSLYALIDREDDIRVGIKSTVIRFGRYDLMIIFSTQAFVLIGLLVLGWLLDMSGCYFLALGVAVVMVIYQYFLAKTKLYYQAFYNNHWLGLVVFLGIVGNYL